MATAIPEKTSLTAWVDREQRDELLRLARTADRSLSAEVRRAVTRYLERDQQEEATHAAPRP